MISSRVIPVDLLNVFPFCAKIFVESQRPKRLGEVPDMSRKGKKIWDVIIIGAGASGMMAAITAAGRGKSVLLLEQMDKPGKKLLATGNGKCNYTNAHMQAECFHGDPVFVQHILDRFSHQDCVAFFRELGIYPKEKNGYFYPNSEQAASVLQVLERELIRRKVTLLTGTCLKQIEQDSYSYICDTSAGCYYGKNLILATGLLAAPKLGSNGSAFGAIKELGHRFMPILPALCGFYCDGMPFKKVSGVRCEALLTLNIDGQVAEKERGELQLTDYGVSGIPVFQLSSPAVRALYEKKSVRMQINFLPQMDSKALSEELQGRRERSYAEETAEQLLCGLVNQKLIGVCLVSAGIKPDTKTIMLSDKCLRAIAKVLTQTEVTLLRVREEEYAQVCTGGIRTTDVNPDTLESLICPGVYIAGELLDVDGICGGYNLQWAWSTGYVAGQSVG